MKTVNKLNQILKLPIGTTLYRPTETDVDWWYYAGENPKSKGSIILISSGNVQKMHGEYIGDGETKPYFLCYKQACKQLLENAKSNVDKVQRIFIDKR